MARLCTHGLKKGIAQGWSDVGRNVSSKPRWRGRFGMPGCGWFFRFEPHSQHYEGCDVMLSARKGMSGHTTQGCRHHTPPTPNPRPSRRIA